MSNEKWNLELSEYIKQGELEKKEWILNDDTVTYSSYENLKETIEYDFDQEKNFSYKDLSLDESISHLSRFISNIWQVHPFCDGN